MIPCMTPAAAPNPLRIFDAINSYQRTFALKAAVELDVFRHIGAGATNVPELAARCHASPKGVRVLCDYLTIIGFLTKSGDQYALAPDAAVFLDSSSPAFIGTTFYFLAHSQHLAHFTDLAAVVRKGGAVTGRGNMEPEAPIWVEFARWMAPMSAMAARDLAALVDIPGRALKVLDIAAGHGAYGIALAQLNPRATIYAQDWENVLELATDQAKRAGVADRFHTIPGSAFDVELGSGYDLVLLPNFLHHFDTATNVELLRKVRSALAEGGRVATVEFVPNDDRVSPQAAASFSLMMLASTEHGDAYTFREIEGMFRAAGYGASRSQPLGPETLILTER